MRTIILGVGWRMQSEKGDIRGEILPKHLSNVEEGDIVLMSSPFEGLEQPWLSKETAKWLVKIGRSECWAWRQPV